MVVEAFKTTRIDDDQRLVFGVASLAKTADGESYEDLQGDEIDPDALEAAMYDYVAASGEGDEMHDREQHAVLVESFVATPAKLAALVRGLGLDVDVTPYKGAAAWVGFRVLDDDTWRRVKKGDRPAFSIETRVLEAD